MAATVTAIKQANVSRLADKLRIVPPSGRAFTVPAFISTPSSVKPTLMLRGEVMVCRTCQGEGFHDDTMCCTVGLAIVPIEAAVKPLGGIAMPTATKL